MEKELRLLIPVWFQSYTLLKGMKTVLLGDLLSIIPLPVCHTCQNIPKYKPIKEVFWYILASVTDW